MSRSAFRHHIFETCYISGRCIHNYYGVSCPYLFLASRRPLGRYLLQFRIPLSVHLLWRISKSLQLNWHWTARIVYDPHIHTRSASVLSLEGNHFPTLPNKEVRSYDLKTPALFALNPCSTGLYTVKHEKLQALLADGFKLPPCSCALSTVPLPYFDISHGSVGAMDVCDNILQCKIGLQLFRVILRFCL
jgi:hypothetical protein